MSNETLKSEADCVVATYNHLHHHHHHHPHQNLHLQHHHNPISIHCSIQDHHQSLLQPPPDEEETGFEKDVRDEDVETMIEGDEEQENKEQTKETLSPRGQADYSNSFELQKLSDPVSNQQICDKFTQLENVHPHEQQTLQSEVIRLHQVRQHAQPVSSSPSSSIDSSEASDDDELESEEEDEEEEVDEDCEKLDEDEADDEYAEDEEEDEGDDEDEDEDEEEEDDDEDESQDEDSDVDPVGTHQYPHLNGGLSGSTIMSDANQTAITNSNASINDDDYDDNVPFANEYNENSTINHNSLSNSELLHSERMLEVTRKLVRSTERDPDRDLRKQVLLRTAIRKLPHFMEYHNHYSETFDQNFRLHNNTMNDNNNTSALECLSPSQYYEHHSIHQLEQQPESYYHSVQPNAIQMSTTSLRMLDLNDDPDAEFAVTAPIETKHHLGYEGPVQHLAPINLDQQHEYASPNLYNSYSQHNSQMNQIQQTNDCNVSPLGTTTTTACHDSIEQPDIVDTHECNAVSLSHNGSLDENDSGLIEDKTGCSDGCSNSSQSSTSSEDSANSSTSHSNDSSGDNNGISLLETSLNTTDDYQHCSYDSGLALFSPKSNKRTSSSIGLDEEMEIDNLSEIPTSEQINNSTGTVANHYKKLRKRELI